jgi:hypothetical protein
LQKGAGGVTAENQVIFGSLCASNEREKRNFSFRDSEDLTPDADVTQLQQVLEKEKLNLQGLRLQLAKKNRQSVAVQRQLDNVPDRTELSQYQRRFLELYNQGMLGQLLFEVRTCSKVTPLYSYSQCQTSRNKTILHPLQHLRGHKTLSRKRNVNS